MGTLATPKMGGSNAVLRICQAGEGTITKSMCVYLASDGKYYKSVNTSASESDVDGIAVTEADSADDWFLICTSGPIIIGTGYTANTAMYLSSTDGGMEEYSTISAGDYITFVGTIIGTTTLMVNINETGDTKT